jgi:hypothetical protein
MNSGEKLPSRNLESCSIELVVQGRQRLIVVLRTGGKSNAATAQHIGHLMRAEVRRHKNHAPGKIHSAVITKRECPPYPECPVTIAIKNRWLFLFHRTE